MTDTLLLSDQQTQSLQPLEDALALAQSRLPAKLPTIRHVMPTNTGKRRFIVGRPALPNRTIYHSTVANGVRGNSTGWLSTNQGSGVSIHTLANRDGSLTEIVPPMWQAFHAGYTLPGWENDKALGIEIENSSNGDRVEPYPAVQIVGAAYRVATWAFSFGISDEHIQPHRAVAVYGPDDPHAGELGRKQDPVGPWPEALFREWVQRWLNFFRSLPPELHEVFIR